MPVFHLNDDPYAMPDPNFAEPSGLVALGGDLSVERLLHAYTSGFFPWYEEGQPILWWSPNPRLVLFPEELKVSRSLKKRIRRRDFEVTMDEAFQQVIQECGATRIKKGEGTWITQEMEDAYIQLHEKGYAHSVESWSDGKLVGGLYGVYLGKCFFGESMFSQATDASKVAFVALVEYLSQKNTMLIDCQVTTKHLMSLGAREISRTSFLERIKQGAQAPSNTNAWSYNG